MTTDAVKENASPSPCIYCGRPTWSTEGICFHCRRLTTGSGETPAVQPPPVAPLELRPPLIDEHGRLAEDITCRACGYNLRGLVPAAMCPECSLPVNRSMHGDLIQFSDPAWVKRLIKGLVFMIIGAVITIVYGVCVTLATATLGTTARVLPLIAMLSALGMGVTFLTVYGVWLLTSPDPGGAESEPLLSARRIARWAAVLQLIALPLEMAGHLNPMAAGNPFVAPTPRLMLLSVLSILLSIAVVIGVLARYQWLHHLAGRIPRQALATQARVVQWGYGISSALLKPAQLAFAIAMPALMRGGGGNPGSGQMSVLLLAGIGNCAGALGLLIFGLWGWILLFHYRSALQQCLTIAEYAWKTTTDNQASDAHRLPQSASGA